MGGVMCPWCGREKKFEFQFDDVQKREIRDSLLLYLCDKEEIGQELDKNKSDLPKRVQCE